MATTGSESEGQQGGGEEGFISALIRSLIHPRSQ
jgi:hypothetical protein